MRGWINEKVVGPEPAILPMFKAPGGKMQEEKHLSLVFLNHRRQNTKNYPGKRPQTVCVCEVCKQKV